MIKELFDRLAKTYDQDVADSDERNLFPFAGYSKVLDFIASDIDRSADLGKTRVLDLGIGTGNLETRIKPEKIELTGVDASEKMLEVAQLKLPLARFFCQDFASGLPEELKNDKFDVIVATYSFHHFSLDHWLEYVHELSHHLTVFGRIYLGDVLFLNQTERQYCKDRFADSWDESEHYHVYEDILRRISDHLAVSFVRISFCAGIVILENYHECTLQTDRVLIKY